MAGGVKCSGLRMYKLIICSHGLWSPALARQSSPYFGPSRPSTWQWLESMRLGDTNSQLTLPSSPLNFAWACGFPVWARLILLAISIQVLVRFAVRVGEWCWWEWCLQDLAGWEVVRCGDSWREGRGSGEWLTFSRGGQFWRILLLRKEVHRRSNRLGQTWFYYKSQHIIS